MRKPFIAGNWKMNMLTNQAINYGEIITEKLKERDVDLKKVDVAIIAPYIHLSALKVVFVLRGIMVGAQNMHYEDEGAFTGEISPAQLKELGIECVVIGHSERRMYFGETSEACAKKVKAAIQKKIRPILCVGESLKDRDGGKHFEVVAKMLQDSLENVTAAEMEGVTLAYEPVWAIGTGRTATPEQAQEMAAHIRSIIREKYGESVAERVIIQYGGSVKPSNIAELMEMEDIDGALVGGASLVPEDFADIVNFDQNRVGKTANGKLVSMIRKG